MRVLIRHLEPLVSRINEITGSPATSYTKKDGKYIANIGNYHLDWAYGGVQLQRMDTDGGGVTQPLGGGYHTKRELYNMLHAFLRGLEK